jgi:hypothetical protein
MQYDYNAMSGTKGSHVESNHQRQTSQTRAKACEDQDGPKPKMSFACLELDANTNMFLLVDAMVNGGK